MALSQGILGERTWHPITFAPEGPARPRSALPASPGACYLKLNPTHAQRTTSKVRGCLYPWERCTTEPPKHHAVGEVQRA